MSTRCGAQINNRGGKNKKKTVKDERRKTDPSRYKKNSSGNSFISVNSG
jgi:hypothetical protein